MSGRTQCIGDRRWRVVFGTAMLWSLSISISTCCAFQVLHGGVAPVQQRPRLALGMSVSDSEEDPAILAIRSLASYHEGQWTGRARSFTVTPDVAAGVVKRKLSPEYTVAVKLATSDVTIDPSTSSAAEPDLGTISLSETVSWSDKFSHRSIPLLQSPGASSSRKEKGSSSGDVDVDDVDGSYSVDLTNPKDFPSVLAGLSGKTDKGLQFVVEHCIAAGEDRRCRCFAIYGEDDALLRVVISDEKRVTDGPSGSKKKSRSSANKDSGALTMSDLIEMQNDVDRLVDKIAANVYTGPEGSSDTPKSSQESSEPGNGTDDDDDDDDDDDESTPMSRLAQLGDAVGEPKEESARKLSSYDMSLLEMTNGVWLGDMMIRETKDVAASPNEGGAGKGFGKASSSSSSSSSPSESAGTFGGWTPGVQKIAYRWMWNFEEEIRQIVDAGKSLGTSMDFYLKKSLAGRICLNESFSRRKPKDERMVYVDWGEDSVGFLLGPFSVQVPRYVNFDPSATMSRVPAVTKPFYTEFGVFQSAPPVVTASSDGVIDVTENPGLEELCWSKIGRLYNYEGRLRQGCTSFSTFKRFELEDGEDDDDDIDDDLAEFL